MFFKANKVRRTEVGFTYKNSEYFEYWWNKKMVGRALKAKINLLSTKKAEWRKILLSRSFHWLLNDNGTFFFSNRKREIVK